MARRKGKVLMVQGTASHVGKSLLVAALCRSFARQGVTVAPFKAQNMSLNSFVTLEGGEIGRAQATQAEAAFVLPHVDMNPVLLKPEGDMTSQVVVLGKVYARTKAGQYYKLRQELWPLVTGSLERLRAQYELVIIEGAGSPAEINLQRFEIVNMRVARYAKAPVLLVADIERGGVFASLYGTVELVGTRERELIKAFIINKFRGDMAILEPGLQMIEKRTGISVLGVLPMFRGLDLPEEDSLGLESERSKAGGVLDIAVIALPHMANFDDFDPLQREPGVSLRFVHSSGELGRPDVVMLPGTKTTMSDLAWLRGNGLAKGILGLHQRGAAVVGICGGYQMLGRRIADPGHVESSVSEVAGLGLLPVETTFAAAKVTQQVWGVVAETGGMLAGCEGAPLEAFEIHMGRTSVEEARRPFRLTSRSGVAVEEMDGAMSADGRVMGTYLHGLFRNAALRRGWLEGLAERKGVRLPPAEAEQRDPLDRLADLVEEHLSMVKIREIAGL